MSQDQLDTPFPDGDGDELSSSSKPAVPATADDEALRATVRDLPEVRTGLRKRPRVQPSRGVIAGLAIGLLGATCLISGIRPDIAQQIVGVGGGDTQVRAFAQLSDALALVLADKGALRR